MNFAKKFFSLCCICLLIFLAGCSGSNENTDLSTDNPVSSEKIHPDKPSDPTAEAIEPSANVPSSNEPVVTSEELLELFAVMENENGPLILSQDLSYKHMVDVMGFDYDEISAEDGTFFYRYICNNDVMAFHYNQNSGPFDYIMYIHYCTQCTICDKYA